MFAALIVGVIVAMVVIVAVEGVTPTVSESVVEAAEL